MEGAGHYRMRRGGQGLLVLLVLVSPLMLCHYVLPRADEPGDDWLCCWAGPERVGDILHLRLGGCPAGWVVAEAGPWGVSVVSVPPDVNEEEDP